MTAGLIDNALKLTGLGSAQGLSLAWSKNISYSFPNSVPTYYPRDYSTLLPDRGGANYTFRQADLFDSLTLEERGAVGNALNNGIASFANIVFREAETGTGDIAFGALKYSPAFPATPNDVILGITQSIGLTNKRFDGSDLPNIKIAGDIWIFDGARSASAGRPNGLNLPGANDPTGYVYEFVLPHEIGHALGLRHPFDVGLGVNSEDDTPENTTKYTILGYTRHGGELRNSTSYQLYDIAALQYLYGRNNTLNAGDTSYSTFDEQTPGLTGLVRDQIFSIWDGGGDDTISAAKYAGSAYIDLRPGHFSSIGPDSFGDNSFVNNNNTVTLGNNGTLGRENISIAFGAYIENAVGGNANDVIIGNIFSNTIDGGAGNDILLGDGFGVAEADRVLKALGRAPTGLVADLDVASGRDADYRLIKKGDFQNGTLPKAADAGDIISGGGGNDLIIGSSRADFLFGDGDNDIIDGGAGNDELEGGTGNDSLYGGSGNDLFYGSAGGEGNDTFIGGAGDDVIDYSIYYEEVPPTAGIEINIGRAGGAKSTKSSVTLTDIYGGTDTIISGIESVIGTAFVDTLRARFLSGAANNIAADIVFDLGYGDNKLDLTGVSSGVTIDLRDALQTVTLAGAVALQFKGVSVVTGGVLAMILFIPVATTSFLIL
jgi:Ca2+-binding RTX toxin-like protein